MKKAPQQAATGLIFFFASGSYLQIRPQGLGKSMNCDSICMRLPWTSSYQILTPEFVSVYVSHDRDSGYPIHGS
jgi:hypothetical protein